MNGVNLLSTIRIAGIPMPLIVFATVLIGLFLLLAVPRLLAHDAGPNDGQIIHACVDKHGNIVIVDPNADGGSKGSKDKGSKGSKDDGGCKKKELSLHWNAGPDDLNGTPNTVIKFDTATTGVDSQITDDGDVVNMGGSTPIHNDLVLRVAGVANFDQYGGGQVSISTPDGAPGIIVTRSGGSNRFDQANFGSYYGFGFNTDWLGFDRTRPSISIQQRNSNPRRPGRVGIGTSNPSGALHVLNDTGGSAKPGHGVTIDSGDVLNNARIEIRDHQGSGNRIPYIDFANDDLNDFDARLILTGDDELSVLGATLKVVGDVRVTGRFRDSSNDAGTAGQVLSSTGSGTDWVAAASAPYTVETFRNFLPNQTVTLTALCNPGDLVIGGYSRGLGVTLDSGNEAINNLGGFSIGSQGWTATVTSVSTQGPKFLIVAAMCETP